MRNKLHTSIVIRLCLIISVLFGLSAFAEDPVASQPGATSVPNLIRYSGVLKDATGATLASQTVAITFSIYKEAEGGIALWHEVRNVTTDASGQYNLLLGSTMPEGVPVELFSDQEQRWLSVQVQGQPEQPRGLLVSVPYAFKAHEAETLGGLPASAFVRAQSADNSSQSRANTPALNAMSVATSGKVSQGGAPRRETKPRIGHPASRVKAHKTTFRFGTAGMRLVDSIAYQGSGALSVNGNVDVLGPDPAYQISGIAVLRGNGSALDTFVGKFAGISGTGRHNVFVGYDTGFYSNGDNNTFVGINSGFNNAANGNTYVGSRTGYSNTAGTENTYTGNLAGFAAKGSYNTYTGSNAGSGIGTTAQIGNYNTFSGAYAGAQNTGSNATFSGYQAGSSNQADGNSFYGYQAGRNNKNAAGNSFFGYQAGQLNTDGANNTFSGYQAGYSNTADAANAYVGYQAGYLGSGSRNTFVGYQAGYRTSSDNTFVGYQAGYNGGGSASTFAGSLAGYNTTGNFNTFYGYGAGWGYAFSGGNTLIGFRAGYASSFNQDSSGADTFVGHLAGLNHLSGGTTPLSEKALVSRISQAAIISSWVKEPDCPTRPDLAIFILAV